MVKFLLVCDHVKNNCAYILFSKALFQDILGCVSGRDGSAHVERLKRHAELPGCHLGIVPEGGMDVDCRIPEDGYPGKPRHELLQELYALRDDRFIELAHPRHVSSGPR